MGRLTIIPSQSYYNLVVYDLTPTQLADFFNSADEMPDSDLKDLTEKGLDFLADRVRDGSYSEDDPSLPNPDDIRKKIDILERKRQKFITIKTGNYLDIDF